MLAPVPLLVVVVALGAPPVAVLHEDPQGKNRQGFVTFLDPDTAAALGTVPVGRTPDRAEFDSETGRLFVLNQGKWPALAGLPTGDAASLAVVDVAGRGSLANLPLPAYPNALVVAPGEGRLFVASAGKKNTQAVVTVIDRRTLQQTGRIPLGPPMYVIGLPERQSALLSPSGRTVFVLRSAPTLNDVAKKSRNVPSRLVTLDAVSGALRNQRELSPRAAQMRLSKDRTALYVLCLGHDDDDKARKAGAYGTLYVLDPETGTTLREIDAGFDPPSLEQHEATGRVFLLVRAPKEGSPHVVVLEGANVVAKLETPPPARVLPVPGSSDFLVLGGGELLKVDGGFGSIHGRAALGFDGADVVSSPDGSTAWVSARRGSTFTAVALASMEHRVSLASGRTGVKAGQSLAIAATARLEFGALRFAPVGVLYEVEHMGDAIYVPRASEPSLAISPDGAHLFVHNRRTEDVTVVDTAKLEILDIDGVGDGVTTTLVPMADGAATLAVWARGTAVVRVDAERNVAVERVGSSLGKLTGRPAFRGDALWIPREDGVEVVSTATGALKALVPMTTPRAVIFP
ncbi:MAG TPA: hypothetical protein VF139_08080 [Candidatus Polarisedimenticolaceae bacterium]